MQERQRSWSVVWVWTSCRVQASFHALSVALEWAAIASSAMAASTGCTRNAVGSSAWKRTLTTDVHGARELHAPCMADHRSPGRPDKLEVVASFCYLGDMLSAADGCELSTTTRVKMAWKKFKVCYQSSTHATSLSKRGRVYSSCVRSAMLHASETWPLTNPNLQHLQRNDRAMIRQICNDRPQDIVTTRSNALLVRLGIEDLTSFWRREDSDGMDMWNAPMVQSWQPLTYRLMESVGLGGPKWHGSSWQRGTAESGSSRLSTLMIDVPGDLVWDLPCVQQASYLEGGPLMWMLPLYLHVNQKSDYDMIWWYLQISYNIHSN